MSRTAYYEAILPHVLSVLDPVTPPHTTPVHGMHRRAAAFTIMRMHERSADAVRVSLNPVVFDVLGTNSASAADVDRALRLLAAAVLLSPPSPDFVQFLVGSNAARLFALDSFLERAPAAKVAVADETRSLETQRNEVREVLHTWLRLGSSREIVDTLSQVLDKAGTADTAAWQSSRNGVQLVPQEYAYGLTQPCCGQRGRHPRLFGLRCTLGRAGRVHGPRRRAAAPCRAVALPRLSDTASASCRAVEAC